MPAYAQKNKNKQFLSPGNVSNNGLFTRASGWHDYCKGGIPMKIDSCTVQIIGPIPMAKETDVTVD